MIFTNKSINIFLNLQQRLHYFSCKVTPSLQPSVEAINNVTQYEYENIRLLTLSASSQTISCFTSSNTNSTSLSKQSIISKSQQNSTNTLWLQGLASSLYHTQIIICNTMLPNQLSTDSSTTCYSISSFVQVTIPQKYNI